MVHVSWFESFVNSERCKTFRRFKGMENWFESFANSERCKTNQPYKRPCRSLRALLIQKDVKR